MQILVTFNTASASHVQAEVAYRSFSKIPTKLIILRRFVY